jgi:uncharacterized protein (TIGR00369 family)
VSVSPPLDSPDDHAEWGEAKSKTIEWRNPLITSSLVPSMSGLEFLRAIRDGVIPPPPIAMLMGARMVVVEPGTVVFEREPDESVYNPLGMVRGGLVCTLADTASACAVQSTLDKGFTYTSIDLNVSYLRAVSAGSGVLRATGVVTKPGRRVAFARAEIVDGAGKVVATATTSCLVMALPS